jgi:methionyl-tRNA formyltransferase
MTAPLKIIFAGTPEFSAIVLKALLQQPDYQIVAVYTQPDRPKGRGRKLTASPVKQIALENNLPVMQPLTLKTSEDQKILAAFQADVMVVVAYGLLLPLPVLTAPKLGCINIHASLLPRWRGAAPIQRAIEAGDVESGVTIMQMNEGLDTGDMLYKVSCPITDIDTSSDLHDKLAELGVQALLETLKLMNENKHKPIPQDDSQATYAHKISKEQAKLNWQDTAEKLARLIRAFNPWPVAYTHNDKKTLRVWQARALPVKANVDLNDHVMGEIIDISAEGIKVAAKNSYLLLEKIQFPGGRIITAADLLNSNKPMLVQGQVLT